MLKAFADWLGVGLKASSGEDSPDSTPAARALRSMHMGQNPLSAIAENLAPQTVQVRISRRVKSAFLPSLLLLSREFVMARSILRRPLKLRKVRESRRRCQQGLRPYGQSPLAPEPCTACASDGSGSLPPLH